MPPSPRAGDVTAGSAYRRLVLALIVLGAAGLLAELLLLEHFEDAWQWAPLVTLALALLASGAVAARPAPATLRAFQAVMGACLLFGAIGVYLHYTGNAEFELEGDPSLGGIKLFWMSIRGATPALAPGALAQLGLLGLLYTYRHPALRSAAGAHAPPDQETT